MRLYKIGSIKVSFTISDWRVGVWFYSFHHKLNIMPLPCVYIVVTFVEIKRITINNVYNDLIVIHGRINSIIMDHDDKDQVTWRKLDEINTRLVATMFNMERRFKIKPFWL
jgi:hypothetical protein